MYSVQFKSIVDGCKNAKQHAATPAIVFFFKKKTLYPTTAVQHTKLMFQLYYFAHIHGPHMHMQRYMRMQIIRLCSPVGQGTGNAIGE
jgi:hypothetical protein